MKPEGRKALAWWLDGYMSADALERQHLLRMRELLETVADPFSRHTFEPGHFTASAFVLHPKRADVVLIEHAKLERWLQPGGHIEPDDADVEQAARREVREETGLDELTLLALEPGVGPLFDLDVHVIPARGQSPSHEHFDVRLAFRARSDALVAATDARAARWVPLERVSPIESDASVMRAVQKLSARSRSVQ